MIELPPGEIEARARLALAGGLFPFAEYDDRDIAAQVLAGRDRGNVLDIRHRSR